jgi:hypothetical protein
MSRYDQIAAIHTTDFSGIIRLTIYRKERYDNVYHSRPQYFG